MEFETCFLAEQDDRSIKGRFDFHIFENLDRIIFFTDEEQAHLSTLQQKFQSKTKELTSMEFHREMERLAIDLS